MNYKITNAMKTGQFDTKYGPMIKYTVQFEGVDAAVEVSQKPDTPAPAVGQELDGTIEDTQYGKKFKKAQAATSGFGGGRAADPATRASIERQSAIKAAVEAVHNYSTVYGLEEKLSLNAYANRIVRLAGVFFEATANGSAPVIAEKPTEDKPETDDINLDDLPFS